MEYTWLEIVWLFLIYSLTGWILEVCIAAVRKKKFINRGFVNGPLCPIYGFSSVLFTLFLPELTNHLFWLFLGGMVLATVLEYSTGVIMHKIFRQKLWDYSDRKWNLDGYICLEYSILWGLSAILTMKFLNPLICMLLRPIPTIVSLPIVWIGVILLVIDFAGTALAVLGMQKEAARLTQFTEGIQKTSQFLEKYNFLLLFQPAWSTKKPITLILTARSLTTWPSAATVMIRRPRSGGPNSPRTLTGSCIVPITTAIQTKLRCSP